MGNKESKMKGVKNQQTENVSQQQKEVVENTFPTPIPKQRTSQRKSVGSIWEDIRKIYKFKDVIGGGHFGTVRLAYKIGEQPKLSYAIKSLAKKNLSPEDIAGLEKEVDILSSLDHPNIIKFFESYQDKHYFHIVMELVRGKEIIDKIIEDGNLTEMKISQVIYKILSAINYCHNVGISHRDIKPDNILFDQDDNEIKIIDFGLSKKYIVKEKMHTILGTPYYVAPEVLKGDYDQKCDVWSIGAIVYLMITGEPPFKGQTNQEIFKKIVSQDINFEHEKFMKISNQGMDIIKKCLVKNPAKRISVSEALEHEWFKNIDNETHSIDKVDQKVFENIKKFQNPNKFKKFVMKFLINTISKSELKNLKEAFFALDINRQGFIKAEELEIAFKKANIVFTKDEVSNFFNNETKDGKMEYSEFLLATINEETLLNKEKLKFSFKHFDVDQNGFIDAEDLKNVLLRAGRKHVNFEELKESIKEASKTNSDKIGLEEFIELLTL